MPISFVIDRRSDLITTSLTGSVTASDFVQGYRDIFASPQFEPGLRELTDWRGMTELGAGTTEFRQVALMAIRAHGSLICQARTAILVMSRFQYGMSRMYVTHAELLNSGCGKDIAETFDDPAAALEWLGLPSFSETTPACLD